MKHETIIELDEVEVDEYDEYQYEVTTDMAQDFINSEMLPVLEEFDYNNPSEDYVPGVATFGMYLKLVEILLIAGFTSEQLIEVITEFDIVNYESVVH